MVSLMPEAQADVLRQERQGQVLWLTLNRPPTNALSPTLLEALGKAVREAEADAGVGAVVFAAAGSHFFSAGADLKEAMAGGIPQYLALGQALMDEIEAMKKPTVSVLQGTALGGGLELAMATDIRLAAEGVRLGQPEVNLGILPAWGGTQRLPRLVGKGRALEMLMTGAAVVASDALQWGLLNRVLPPDHLRDYAQNLAMKLSLQAPLALGAIKSSVGKGLEGGLKAGLQAEQAALGHLMTTGKSVV